MRREFVIGIGILSIVTLLCFRLVFTGRVPIPVDTVVGLYHPFRDLYAKEYPRGIPFKNPLITDPVSQQIPWRVLALEQIKELQLPLWNPYAMTGYPLLGNIQSAPFYPLNVVLLLMPFLVGWSVLIALQPLLGGMFMYLYLRNLKLHFTSSIFGAVTFGFCGFFLAWLEWGTVAHTALWFPLLFLASDKIMQNQKKWFFAGILLVSLISSFLAGHLQTFIYGVGIAASYIIFRLWQTKDKKQYMLIFGGAFVAFALLLLPIWWQQLQLILLSARDVDLNWQQLGWFIPREHIIQFLAPDFFGNPATGNYWGVWNYGEFLGYAGIFPLFFALIGITRKNKTTLFFAGLVLVSLLFAVKSPLAKLPYLFELPFFSSTQPTRLLFVVDFSLSILAAFGLDRLLREKKLSFLYPGVLLAAFLAVFLFGYFGSTQWQIISLENWAVAKRNLILPSFLVLSAVGAFLFWRVFNYSVLRKVILFGIIAVTVFDLLFIANKFNSFSNPEYFFPQTKTLEFLQKQPGQFRMMTTNRTIFHPNFQVMYKLQSINGYDPLYLGRFGELMAAMGRRQPDISTPFGFFRIVTPDAFDSKIADLMGVKYVLSTADISHLKLKKVFAEGEVQVYQNTKAYPRAFFVRNVVLAENKQDVLNKMFNQKVDLRITAIIEDADVSLERDTFSYQTSVVTIKEYTPNKVVIETQNEGDGFLVFTDSYYPTWKATIDNKDVSIIRTDYNFRGILVPKGKHTIQFNNRLF